ncbi:MAG: hypothetical protein Tsb0026_19690 [Sulfuricaulis sp.]
MVIQFGSEQEFERLLAGLAQEVVDAAIHWRLYSDLTKAIEVFSIEYNQSPAFWTLTFQSHLDATIFRLIRIYDGNSESLSLRNLLDTIKQNINLFDTDKFRQRLKSNPFVNSLASDIRKPDVVQLDKDISYASTSNHLVKKLTIWRNNLFAHRKAKMTARGYNLATDYPITGEDVGELVKKSVEILNRYSSLFRAETHSTQIVGHDDYKFVLKSIRKNLEQMHKETEALLKKHGKSAKES